jgi:hypothetical protein
VAVVLMDNLREYPTLNLFLNKLRAPQPIMYPRDPRQLSSQAKLLSLLAGFSPIYCSQTRTDQPSRSNIIVP